MPKQEISAVPPCTTTPSVKKGVSPRGDRIASYRDHFIELHTDEGVYLSTFINGFATNFSCVKFSHDARMLIAGSVTGEVCAWDMEHKGYPVLLMNRVTRSYAPCRDIVSAPSGTAIALLSEAHEVQVWCVQHRVLMEQLSVHPNARRLDWSVDSCVLSTDAGDWFTVDQCPSPHCFANEVIEEE